MESYTDNFLAEKMSMSKEAQGKPTLCCPFGKTPGHPCRICRSSAITAYNGMKPSERAERDKQAKHSQAMKGW